MDENISALNLNELQKLANKSASSKQQNRTSTLDHTRRFKYATMSDSDGCEREVLRMLQLCKHTLYASGHLLQDLMFSTNAPTEESLQVKSFVS
jgi:hypothetical protein